MTSQLSKAETVGTATKTVILSAATFTAVYGGLSAFTGWLCTQSQASLLTTSTKTRPIIEKENLRCCQRSENDRNRSLYITNTSGVSGVFFDKQREKWVASITYNSKKIYLGRYDAKEDAVMARLTKEVELYREFAPQKALLETLSLCSNGTLA